jgi:hypothetical protein
MWAVNRMADDTEALSRTIVFLRMAGIELRRLGDLAPDIAIQLRHTADQCDREAEDLSNRFGLDPLLH